MKWINPHFSGACCDLTRKTKQKHFCVLFSGNAVYTKGGFKSEETGRFLHLQNKYSKSLSWAENLNKLFTVLGGKFKFSAHDSNLEYLSWRSKNPPVSSDLKPPLGNSRLKV